MPAPPSFVAEYHDGTKHQFDRFARSLGYLDWASQPHPFRSFAGAPVHPLWPAPGGGGGRYVPPPRSYRQLTHPSADAQPVGREQIGDLLRHAVGLSAWKRFAASRWSLRVNPSSGNLHPTEAYVVAGPLTGISDLPAVYHYAADRHAVERRCTFDPSAWAAAPPVEMLLVALTSIHWRESWKYGERAFRYCQHDLGHAVAAFTFSAALLGWRTVLLAEWSHRDIAALTGIERDEDFVDAEREEPGCVLAVASGEVPASLPSAAPRLAAAARMGQWSGRANQLSEDHVQWTFIDEIAAATRDDGHQVSRRARDSAASSTRGTQVEDADARGIVLRRRSAVAFDARSSIPAARFFDMVSGLVPGDRLPWNTLWWTPRIHLILFVHRVDALAPGMYLLGRDREGAERLRMALTREFLWQPAHAQLPLYSLAVGDCRGTARRLSCDQDIAADGFFSLAMIAEFSASLEEFGPSFYRHLFWECGVLGQALYLEAEAAGARATGIGCFYDDPVHEALGLKGHGFQSLYHFAVGSAVDDARLTTEPGYQWEIR